MNINSVNSNKTYKIFGVLNQYRISNDGHIQRYYKNEWIDVKVKYDPTNSKNGGYLRCYFSNLNRVGDKVWTRVHRIVAWLYCENPNKLNNVDHIDGNKLNNSYTNLRWVTTAENTQSACRLGLIRKEDHYYKGRIDDCTVLTMLTFKMGKYPNKILCDNLAIDISSISRHITNPNSGPPFMNKFISEILHGT